MRAPRPVVAATALALAVSMMAPLVLTSPAAAVDDAGCQAMTAPAYERVNPANDVMLVTAWPSEAEGAEANFGFTVDLGTPMRVSTAPAQGLVAVHRLYHPVTRDFAYLTSDSEIANAAAQVRLRRRGDGLLRGARRHDVHGARVSLPAGTGPSAGPRLTSGPPWKRMDGSSSWSPSTPSPRAPLRRHRRPGRADTTFSFAVIPDTQNETFSGDVRMPERVEWLLANRQSLDLRWVLHSGDVHNWDTPTTPSTRR